MSKLAKLYYLDEGAALHPAQKCLFNPHAALHLARNRLFGLLAALHLARNRLFDLHAALHLAKSMLPVLIPLLISSFRRAEELGDAMDSRCYSSSSKRTKFRKLKTSWRDLVGVLVTAVCLVGVILLNSYVGGIV